MVIMTNIDGFTIKRISVDSRELCNILTWEAIIRLQVDLTKLKKIRTPLVGIKGKPVRVEGSVKLPITI